MKLKAVMCVGLLALGGTAAAVIAPGGGTDYFETEKPAADQSKLIYPLFNADKGETRGVLLIQNGQVIAKRYGTGYSDKNRFISWSMAKTVTAALVGELVADGKLTLDAPAPVAEWQGANDPRRAITLRQLLNMASGLRHVEVGDPVENSDTNQALFVRGTDAIANYAIGQPLEAKPGAKFEYSSLTTVILAEIITRALTDSKDPVVRAKAYQAFAEERLFKPAGITSAVMDFDGSGTQIGGSIIYLTLDDYGRWGQLLLQGKGIDGAQIVAPDWLNFMRAPSPTNPEYGGQTWLNRVGINGTSELFPGKGPDSVYSCIGHLGQFVIVSPEQNLVLVRVGKTDDGSADFPRLRNALGDIVATVK
jgi:CubicO group peptidase (beta-lactamase class C family)